MDFRTAYTRRLEKASRRQKRFGTLVVFGVTAGVAALLVPELVGAHDERHPVVGTAPAPAAAPVLAAATPQQAAAPRRVYPYSIIPGGVSGVAELKRVIRADKVVAAHYADFDADKAQEVTVTRPRAVHVSYRKGDQVFWTAKKVMLAQGETLLSDGSNEMRARCANRISDVPRFPVEAHGPSEEELDTVLASATGEEGMFLAASAGSVAEAGGSGSRYPLGYFPDGAGLVQPASSLASMRAGMASVPQADRSALYDLSTGNRVSRMAQSSASEGDAGATPGTGASGGGATGSGSGSETMSPPGDGSTPGTGGTTPADGDPSTTPGTGDPATPGSGNGGTGGDDSSGGTGSGSQPPTPAPETGPELPSQGPATPGAPQPTPGDAELPVAPVEVPEPGTLWLSSAAIAGMLWLRRKERGIQR